MHARSGQNHFVRGRCPIVKELIDVVFISNNVQKEVDHLLTELDLRNYYCSYSWKSDTWQAGFPEICRLEREISNAALMGKIGKEDLLNIAAWGEYRNPGRIECQNNLNITLYHEGKPAFWLKNEIANVITAIQNQVRGFGPTYSSKLLRFAVPQIFGAIDTRLVRVLGLGDPEVKKYHLLDLSAQPGYYGWGISKIQPGWPSEYAVWIAILHLIARRLNNDGIDCPHPEKILKGGFREQGQWIAADVEMALFRFASEQTRCRHVEKVCIMEK